MGDDAEDSVGVEGEGAIYGGVYASVEGELPDTGNAAGNQTSDGRNDPPDLEAVSQILQDEAFPSVPAATALRSARIERLLRSATYDRQRQQLIRAAVPEQLVYSVLGALELNGGTLTRVALVRFTGVPAVRLQGLLPLLRRLLNVDGFEVLRIDDGSGTVALDLRLLDEQFQIGVQE
jgi:hypothetical protein